MTTMRGTKKSEPYYFGEGQEFENQKAAVIHAHHERNEMIKQLGSQLDGVPQISINGSMVQVVIPVRWENN